MKADERKCPRCAEPIKSDALVCKHCRYELTAEEVEAGRAAAKKRQTIAGIGCLGLIAVIVLPLAMCSSSDAGPEGVVAEKVGAAESGNVLADYPSLAAAIASTDQECLGAMEPVVKSVQAAADGTGELADAYTAAKNAEDICENARTSIAAMTLSISLPSKAQEQVDAALDHCATVQMIRRNAMRTLMVALDGDRRPSVISEFKTQANASEGGTLVCAARLLSAGEVLGIDAETLTKQMK